MKPIKEDNGGILANLDEVEFSTNMDWDGVLSRITDEETIICTYGEPDAEYNPFLKTHLPHMSNVMIVNGLNSKVCSEDAYYKKIKSFNSNAKVYIKDTTHAKFLLIAPNEVYVTSQNVGYSDWFQVTVHIKDQGAFDFYKKVIYAYAEKKLYSDLAKDWDALRFLAPERQIIGTIGQNSSASCVTVQAPLCKLFRMTNWNAKFNNIRDHHFTICTYTLPDYNYAEMTVKKLLSYGNKVKIIINSQFKSVAERLDNAIKDSRFSYVCHPAIHAKIVLCDNHSVWIGSHNFGNSRWFESLYQIKNCPNVYDYYNQKLQDFIYSDLSINDFIFPDE